MKIQNIKKYLSKSKLLGNNTKVKDIKFLGGGNHFNYRLNTNRGDFVLRITRQDALSAGILFNIPNEFLILKLVEKYKVAPKPITLDLEGFNQSVLVEKFEKGRLYKDFKKLDKDKFDVIIRLMLKISKINITENEFPFPFYYSQYSTNIKVWKIGLSEIKELSKKEKYVLNMVKEMEKVARRAAGVLENNQNILSRAPRTFIYNDIHGGNTIWDPKTKTAKFIDWQKVSLGDPAFMPAVFALAFEDKSGKDRDEFFREVADSYNKVAKIKNFEKLFWLRILEREVANMIWVIWAFKKRGKKIPFKKIEEYDRYNRTKKLVEDIKNLK